MSFIPLHHIHIQPINNDRTKSGVYLTPDTTKSIHTGKILYIPEHIEINIKPNDIIYYRKSTIIDLEDGTALIDKSNVIGKEI